MTIFGIAGCTALVICGMGIRDTSVALSPKQYGHITRYDLLAVANPDDFSQTCAALDERSAANDFNVTVTSTLPIMTDNVTFTFGGKSETVQLIVVPDDRTSDLGDYVRLEDESKEPLPLRDGDVYLSKVHSWCWGFSRAIRLTSRIRRSMLPRSKSATFRLTIWATRFT